MSNPYGFAVREDGQCLPSEIDCGGTWGNYHACCPNSSFCQNNYNFACCDTQDRNCTDILVPKPKCANSTWTLFDNNGYFCCKPGNIGYKPGNQNADGCAPATGFTFAQNDTILPVISVSSASSSSSTSSPSTSSSTATITASSTSAPASSKHTNTPAIAGGVVGGIVGLAMLAALAIFFLRKKRANSTAHELQVPTTTDMKYHQPTAELPVSEQRTELPTKNDPPVELQ